MNIKIKLTKNIGNATTISEIEILDYKQSEYGGIPLKDIQTIIDKLKSNEEK